MAKTFEEFPGVEWVEGTKEFVRVIGEKCTGCAYCIRVCLGNCYQIKDNKASIKSLDNCMECAACWYVCPEGAIDFSWPPGGTGYRTDWG